MPGVRFLRESLVFGSVLLAATFVVGLSIASAEQITYDILDHPAAEIDVKSGFQDVVSGTITATTIGTLGTYTAGSSDPSTEPVNVDLAFSVTISTPLFTTPITFSGDGPLSNYLGSGSVTFTSNPVTGGAVILGGYLSLMSNQGGGSYDLYFRPDIDSYMGSLTFPNSLNGASVEFDQTPATSLDPAPWTIATVSAPEPSALAPLVTAFLGLGGFYLPRARRLGA